MLCARLSVEDSRAGDDAQAGQRIDRVPAVLIAGGPEIETGLRMIDARAEGLDGRAQHRATRAVELLLREDVLLVRQCGGRSGLNGPGHDHPRVLARGGERLDEGRVARQERRAVACQVRLLRERVDGQHPGVVLPHNGGVEDAGRGLVALPAQPGVALIGGEDDARLPRPPHDLAQGPGVEHATGGVARRVDPQQTDPVQRGTGQDVIDVQHPGLDPGQRRTHRVGGVGGRRMRDGESPPGQSQQGGQPRDGLLRPHQRQDLGRGVDGRTEHACVPVGDRAAQLRRAGRRGIAGPVRGRSERLAHEGRCGVDRGADRQVADAAGMRGGRLAVGREGVPRVVGQGQSESGLRHGALSPATAAAARR